LLCQWLHERTATLIVAEFNVKPFAKFADKVGAGSSSCSSAALTLPQVEYMAAAYERGLQE
jgi:hypothetical protein